MPARGFNYREMRYAMERQICPQDTTASSQMLIAEHGDSTTESEGATLQMGVPFAEYLMWPQLSQTTLKVGKKSMKHLKAAWDEEIVSVPTDDMVLGSALHVAFLEPELILDKVVKWDGGTRRGKDWEAFKAEHAGKYILTEKQHSDLQGMIRSLRSHKEVRQWLSRIEAVEVSTVGMVNGVQMKGRIDALTPDPLIDLKKVVDGDRAIFRKRLFDYGYDLQGAVYRELFNRERFFCCTVESDPPHDVVMYDLTPLLDVGWKKVCELTDQVGECLRTNTWPGRAETIETLEVPEWMGQTADIHPTF